MPVIDEIQIIATPGQFTEVVVTPDSPASAIIEITPDPTPQILIGTVQLVNQSVSRVNVLPDISNTYTPDAATTDVGLIVTPVADFAVEAPLNSVIDEQRLIIKIKSSAPGFTPSWHPIYISSGVSSLPVAALPASKTVTFGFIYDKAQAKWVLLAADPIGY